MKDITDIKKKLFKQIAFQNCKVTSLSQCKNKDNCTCLVAAEMAAYIKVLIPSSYANLTIKDFNGMSLNKTEQLIGIDVALKVKKQLIDICWGGLTINDIREKDIAELNKFSTIDNIYELGKNIAIYASSYTFVDGIVTKKKSGKTLCASIIMKEAIKRRIAATKNQSHTYEWINFDSLIYHLANKDSVESSYLKTANWLVIDNIKDVLDMSTKMKSYYAHLLDVFFYERIENNLPTIMVFNFDIDESASIANDSFGSALSQILNRTNTVRIKLSD
ncbi:MAG: hypothetical protein WDA06_00080 [Phenylobacterium sp.]